MRSASAFAPGRVELLGNHTDYNEGFVLSAAIDKGTVANLESRDDEEIRLSSRDAEGLVTSRLQHIEPLAKGHWANYPLGVTDGLQNAGFSLGGFAAQYQTTLPVGAGLSSSAALEVSTAKGLAKLFHLDIAPLLLARICRLAENEFVGVNSGLLDQISSVFGKRGHVIFLDCRTEEVRLIKFPESLVLLIIHSGAAHRLVGGEYNDRREQCFRAARLLGVPFLRDATMEQLENAKSRIDPVIYRRALHIVGENERVQNAVQFLEGDQFDAFGALMFESHTSSQINFENSTPDLDALVEIAGTRPEILGSRLTGGGFGGATISLVRREAVDAVSDYVTTEYERRTGHRATAFTSEIADGAH
jgi:galactokinase